MKKVVFLLSSLFVLSGCTSQELPAEESSSIVLEEMDKENALIHLEEITYRMVNASLDENGSFEQRSEAEAGLAKIDSEREKILGQYDPNDPKVEGVLTIADWTEKTLEEMLAEDFTAATDTAVIVGGEIADYASEYLDGKFPPSLETFLKIQEITEQNQ